VWLVGGVLVFWLLVLALVVTSTPTPARAKQTPAATVSGGALAVIHAPPLQVWPIPIDRTTFDAYDRAVLDDDEGAIMEALSQPGWILVANGQVVKVVVVDGAASQIEVVDGPDAGGRGWLKTRQLRPLP
jgi:hypothetical protein